MTYAELPGIDHRGHQSVAGTTLASLLDEVGGYEGHVEHPFTGERFPVSLEQWRGAGSRDDLALPGVRRPSLSDAVAMAVVSPPGTDAPLPRDEPRFVSARSWERQHRQEVPNVLRRLVFTPCGPGRCRAPPRTRRPENHPQSHNSPNCPDRTFRPG